MCAMAVICRSSFFAQHVTYRKISLIVASFLIHFLADGMSFSFGVIFVALQEKFQENASYTSVIGSLFYAIPLLFGPVASCLADRFGYRATTIAGGLLTALGYFASKFADSIPLLWVTYGLCIGFGLCLVYATAVIVLAPCFGDNIGLALGIAVGGAGIGTFAFAPLTQMLLEEYGLDGTFLLLGALSLHFVVCGALMGPVITQSGINETECPTVCVTDSGLDNRLPHRAPQHRSLLSLAGNMGAYWWFSRSALDLASAAADQHLFYSHNHAHRLRRHTFDCAPSEAVPYRKILHQNGVDYSKEALLSVPGPCAEQAQDADPKLSRKDVPQQYSCGCFPSWLELFKLPLFNVFFFSYFVLYLFSDTVFVYLPDLAISCGQSKDRAALLLSVIGILNMLANPLAGLFTTKLSPLGRARFLGASLLVSGFTVALMPNMQSFALFVCVCAVFGAAASGDPTVGPAVLLDTVKVSRFSPAFGLVSCAQGFATLFGPPLMGYLFDVTGSYKVSFYLSGCGMAVTGCIVCAGFYVLLRNKNVVVDK